MSQNKDFKTQNYNSNTLKRTQKPIEMPKPLSKAPIPYSSQTTAHARRTKSGDYKMTQSKVLQHRSRQISPSAT